MMNPTMNQQPGPRDPVFPDPVFPEPVFPDEFVPVDLRGTPLRSAAYVYPMPPLTVGRTPGLRESLLAWASNAVAWASLVGSAVLLVIAFSRTLADQDSDGYFLAGLGLWLVGSVAAVCAVVLLVTSFVARLRAGELRRAAPVVDLVFLAVVTAASVLTAAFPVLAFS
ncbi:hypothetical protein [Gordonia paraffinivorans]|uniref:hypothetical protein n=1 Tax=Gordonia paraffinivorans TaxID=175628 RepID=UPI002431B02A|nr:hypothetical protein [Gordonia paraffinivorans]